MANKKELRKQISHIRNSLTPEQRHAKSYEIARRVIEHERYKDAETIFLFCSYKSEVDTSEILRHALDNGKQVYLPKVEYDERSGSDEMEFYQILSEEDVCEGYKGIYEPIGNHTRKMIPEVIHGKMLMILPGLVFDKRGNRIGYGGGFYDRYLRRLEFALEIKNAPTICKMAVAFACQIVEDEQIQAEAHDVKVSYIVTESDVFVV